ncbi:phosphotransferase enzyme family protein [Nocardia sp. NPDC058666]|uniref:phosphotransferase enzyme family protein n=1 Tax=Nocardia sp. NPDC058666 TaxID=3346587 RepID=UPI0036576E70
MSTDGTGTRSVLEEAATISGIDPDGAVLIRRGSNSIYRIGDLIARIGTTGAAEVAQQELRISQWLSHSGLPAVEAADVAIPMVVVDGRPVTWWKRIPDHRPSTPAELGAALQHLHDLAPPTAFALPDYDPFLGIRQRIVVAGDLAVEDRNWLLAHHDSLLDHYMNLDPPAVRAVIHGDAWQGNVVVPSDGVPTILDLERVSMGRKEWDLVQIAADYVDFDRLSSHDYASFVDAYDCDVTAHGSFRLLANIQELRWTAFALSQSETNAKASEQVRHRLACLRGEIARPWRWEAL